MQLDKVLVVGKDAATQELVRSIASQLFSADDINDAWDTIPSIRPDLILLDPTISHDQSAHFLSSAAGKSIAAPTVIVSETLSASTAAEHIKLGAFDILPGIDDQKLELLVKKIKHLSVPSSQAPLENSPQPVLESIVGTSKATLHALEMVNIVAHSNCNPVLIIGETGTGKEMVAQSIHNARHGAQQTFVGINCAALTANLLESELFGHVKGAFTGADRDKVGLLEIAGSGTVLLDEISEMPLELQAKLLRVLQEKKFRKVGGTKEIICHATFIATSNRNLYKDAQAGKFRQDLYYRLAVCPITLLPLRAPQRKDDIAILAEHFLRTSTICPNKAGKVKAFTKLALEALHRHNWPGNVRELRNVIDRAVLLENTDKIGLSSLSFNPEQSCEPEQNQQCASADFSLERAEKELIGRALQESGWQKTRAAALLGITRATLYAKVKQYEIKIPSNASPMLAEVEA